MRLYHGSPHRFTAFDLKHSGSGEGASVYGRGVYLAEARAVALSYVLELTDLNGGPARLDTTGLIWTRRNTVAQGIEGHERLVNNLRQQLDAGCSEVQGLLDKEQRALEFLRCGGPGFLYTVEFDDAQAERMLDLDAKLREQAQPVRAALLHAAYPLGAAALPSEYFHHGFTGADLVRRLETVSGHPEDVHSYLRDIGLTGTRYLDRFSRGERAGSRNRVLYNPEDAYITHINDEPVSELQDSSDEAPEAGFTDRAGMLNPS